MNAMFTRKKAYLFAAALVLGTAILGNSAPAHAKPKDPIAPKKCSLRYSDGSVAYFNEGDQVWDVFLAKFKTCKNGQWQFEAGPQSPVAPTDGRVNAE